MSAAEWICCVSINLIVNFCPGNIVSARQVTPTDGLFSLLPQPQGTALTAEKVITRVENSYTAWSDWTPCSKSCTQQRFRRCKTEELNCTEKVLTAERTCLKAKGRCSVRRLPKKQTDTKSVIEDIIYDLIYYEWSEWSACTRTCKKRRYRTCALRRWCKHTVLMEEKACSAPGTDCERRYALADPDDYDDEADENHRHDKKKEENRKPESTEAAKNKKKLGKRKPSRTRPSGEQVAWDPSTCGRRNVTGSYRIVGGTESRKGSWPWQVAIMTKWKEQYCGGALIAPEWVLTAAHCVRKKSRKRRVLVRTGEYDLSEYEGSETTQRIETDFVHDGFDIDTIDNDIALLKLRNPVPPSQYVNFACVPEATDQLPPDTLCYAIGWGKMRDTHLFGADVLREARVPLVANSRCSDAFDYEITSNQMCAGYNKGGVDTCAGDSGGPLMCEIVKDGVARWYAYGVTSFGEGCGDKGKYGIYTRVTNFVEWIRAVINRPTPRS